MNNVLYGNLQSNTIDINTVRNYDSPQGATTVYIATDAIVRVTTDGVTTPTATAGLLIPGGSTAVFACRHNTTNGVRIFATAAANVSVQFLGSGR